MRWLNYHHLLYFHVVAREGGLQAASRILRVSHPTLSEQIRRLESALGVPLFDRSGRRLVLTEAGRRVQAYAEEIFGLGQALLDDIEGRGPQRALHLRVGVANVLAKLVARRLLAPVLTLFADGRLRASISQDEHDALLGRLAVHRLDLVLSDRPVAAGSGVRARHRLLGRSGVEFLGTEALHARYGPDFPASLEAAPVLLPDSGAGLRRQLDRWFEEQSLRPDVVAELSDSGLLKSLGAEGYGIIPVPAVVAAEAAAQYRLRSLGSAPGLELRFYGIVTGRSGEHPSVKSVLAAAEA